MCQAHSLFFNKAECCFRHYYLVGFIIMFPRLYVEGSIMHNRNYTEQDAIQRLLLFEEGLSGIIGLMKEEKKGCFER